MTDNSTAGLCRLTIRAPSRDIDLAVPADVPVADLLPTVLRYAREGLEESGLDHGGWVLQRLGGAALDEAGTLEGQDLHDGDVLYLRPYNDELPEVRLDDLVDGIATATRARQNGWGPAASRRLLGGLVILALLAGLVVLIAPGGPTGPSRLLALAGCSLLLVVGSATASRAMGDTALAAALGFMAVVYATLAGWLVPGYDTITAEDTTSGVLSAQLLAAAAVGAGAAVLTAAAAGAHIAVFVTTALVALAAAVTGAVTIGFDIPLGSAAAAVAALFVIFGAFVPAIAFKLAGMRMPALPTNPQQLQEAIDPYDPQDVTSRTARAVDWMTALYAATGAVCTGCLTALVSRAEAPEIWTAGALVALLLLHGRGMVNVWQRLSLVIPGAWGAVALTLTWMQALGPSDRLLLLAGVLLAAAALAIVSWTIPGRRIVPHWGRAAELLQSVLAISLLPLTLWTLGVFGFLRALNS